ncbi:hypothetical protein DEG01_011420 [Xanthomonas vasicola]|nr:hypothetical protein DEF99_010375 [Xanthomonas vasicola]RJN14858.1 hypothetical protein DEG01_011420 [Xanthomonas vasicola]RJN29893.1 hypothetical protein DEF94_005745 [Xanthomonas vasicola]
MHADCMRVRSAPASAWTVMGSRDAQAKLEDAATHTAAYGAANHGHQSRCVLKRAVRKVFFQLPIRTAQLIEPKRSA